MAHVTLCVDALEPRPGEIGRYTWELCKGLTDRDGVSSIRFFGAIGYSTIRELLLRGERLKGRRYALRNWWDKRGMRSSIVHGPNYFLPPFADTGVITVHDLSVFRYPETHPAERVRIFERESPGRCRARPTSLPTPKPSVASSSKRLQTARRRHGGAIGRGS